MTGGVTGRITPPAGKSKKKIIRIVIGAAACMLVLCGVLFALNYNTVLLFLGHGRVQVASMDQLKEKLQNNNVYEDVQVKKNADGTQTLTAVSNDGAVALTAATDTAGKLKISGKIDAAKIDAVNKSRIDVNDIQSMKNIADQYVGTLVDQSSVTGVEGYVAKEVLSQYQSKQQTFTVNKDFDGAAVYVSGSFETGQIKFDLTR